MRISALWPMTDAKLLNIDPEIFILYSARNQIQNYSSFPSAEIIPIDSNAIFILIEGQSSVLPFYPKEKRRSLLAILVEECGTEFLIMVFGHCIRCLSTVPLSKFDACCWKHTKIPSKTRSNLMSFMISGWVFMNLRKI